MNYQNIDTGVINDDDYPWMPFTPYSETVMLKVLKANPVTGETLTLLKVPAGEEMATHHHTGTVIVYTVQGAWKYKEHDWTALPGSVVYETASTVHTPVGLAGYGDDVITFNIVQGELLYLDADGKIIAIENWKTMVERYFAYCAANNITPKDPTLFEG